MHPYERYRTFPRRIPIRSEKDGIIRSERNQSARTTVAPTEAGRSEAGEAANDRAAAPAVEKTDWQSRALRLQAEMDNFRKRQTRRADEAIAAERERLLRLILPLADNLARALNHDDQDDESLHQGVQLIQRELERLLEAEGVSRIDTVDRPFTPDLHEALATVPADGVEPNIIVEEIEAGYLLGDRLLRPARVVVAA